MRNVFWAIAFVVAYFVAWTGSYVLFWVLRGDSIEFTYYFQALFAAWTFGGIEGGPQLMLIFSFVMFAPMAVLLFLLRRHFKHGSHAL